MTVQVLVLYCGLCCCLQSEQTNAEYAKHIKELEERLRDFEQRYANAQATIKVRVLTPQSRSATELLESSSRFLPRAQAKILRRQADRPTWYLPSRENGSGQLPGAGGRGVGGGGRRLDDEVVSRSRSQYALAVSPHTTAPTTAAFTASGPLLVSGTAAAAERTRALRFRTPPIEPAPSPLDDDTVHDVLHRSAFINSHM